MTTVERAGVRRLLSVGILAVLGGSPAWVGASPAAADPAAAAPAAALGPVEFNTVFVGGDNKIDVSRFERGNVALPGTYAVDILLNGEWKGRQDITFKDMPGLDSAQPCFDGKFLASLGVDLKRLEQDAAAASKLLPETMLCGNLDTYIPGAAMSFDAGDVSLSFSVPQIYVNRAARGYVDPSLWDRGVNAGFVGYNFNTFTTSTGNHDSTSSYLGLNAGVNLGDWHFRHSGSLNWSTGQGAYYQRNQTYAQRDLPSLQSQLVVGETNTDGTLFDSVRVRGVSMYTDDRMLPDSQTGYAPIVRGVADTNARVVVKQRGIEIANLTVPAGPFEINDLYATGYGGDLEVTVTEADGRVKQFSVPYSASVNLLRPGYSRYSATVGQLAQLGLRSQPYVAQGTWQYGINNLITGYGGATLAQGYASAMAGAALNTPVGAFSLDATTAHTAIPGQSGRTGQSYQARYSKTLGEKGTSFSVGAYRYSTDGYLGLYNAMAVRDAAKYGNNMNIGIPRSRVDLTMSQDMGRWGTLSLTGSNQSYQNSASKSLNYSLGYSNRWKSVSYGLNVQRIRNIFDTTPDVDSLSGFIAQRSRTTATDTQYMFNVSVPLGTSRQAPMLRNSVMHMGRGNQFTSAVNGTLGSDQQLAYNVSAGRTTGTGASGNFNANVQYQMSAASLSAGYAQGTGYRGGSLGASGGVVVVGDGIHFSQTLGDTMGIVEAPGAKGATLSSARGVKLDSRGSAVVPYMVPYRLNEIGLDPKGTSHDVELQSTSQKVAPKLGAVVVLKYDTVTGRAAVIKLMSDSGEPVPFGADVFDAEGKHVGVMGQASRAMVRGIADQGRLTVRWGDDAASSCSFDYSLPKAQGDDDVMTIVQSKCVAVNANALASNKAAP